MNHMPGFRGNPFDLGSVPDFNIEEYINKKRLLQAENPEEMDSLTAYSNYKKEL